MGCKFFIDSGPREFDRKPTVYTCPYIGLFYIPNYTFVSCWNTVYTLPSSGNETMVGKNLASRARDCEYRCVVYGQTLMCLSIVLYSELEQAKELYFTIIKINKSHFRKFNLSI